MHTYDLKPSERRQYQDILDSIDANGGLYRTDTEGAICPDASGAAQALDYVVLRTRRFLVDAHGRLWRFFAEGSPKNPSASDGGGAPWRNNRVEMWNGRWRRITDADGQARWAKVLVARPIDKRVNGHPGLSQIDWYLNVKKYRHPLDGPDSPDEADTPNARTHDNGTGQEHGRSNGGGAHSADAAAGAAERKPARNGAKAARTNRPQS